MKTALLNISLLMMLAFTESCSSTSLIVKSIPNNPTSYIFNAKIPQVQNAVKSSYYTIGYWGGDIDFVGDSLMLSALEKNKVNKNDFYFTGGFFPKSAIYFTKKEKALPFWADFQLHISYVDSIHTKVEIFIINPRIEVGKKIFPSFPHFGDNPKYKSAASTTIEEYNILLQIGKSFGEKDMPPLKKTKIL